MQILKFLVSSFSLINLYSWISFTFYSFMKIGEIWIVTNTRILIIINHEFFLKYENSLYVFDVFYKQLFLWAPLLRTSLKLSFAWNQNSLFMNENNKIFSVTQPMNHHHSKHCTIIPESMKLCKQISNAVTHHPTTMIKLDLWHSASANNVSRASTSVDKRWRHGRQGSIAEGRIA